MTPDPTPEQINPIRQRLAQYSREDVPPDLSELDRQILRDALLWFNDLSDYQTIGVCADSLAQAQAALRAYIAALSQPKRLDIPPREGAVFLKFNTLNSAWYADSYSGPSRGVLVTYHASEPEVDAVNGTYGPFPLDLFSQQAGHR
ncbi:DUF1824 family protein [Romeria aff. gracilis LEGE 07310]|uniref:DUF1824 family protein n=1 Tax=Vasconcelosia minhoensis LEGE 07310 TaxID=915328 RepID=A0A8J7DPR4_9CYAN|nr:DUF1824 family protein [Romeria gracilis]MBE9080150.1 DUF1824 family protein [Romeria aff. gracilis LEGE 07310]